MGEDDIVELLWESGHVVESSQAERPSFPPPVLRGSGSGGGGSGAEETAPLPPLQSQQQHQNLFMGEDEMASWLHQHPLGQEDDQLRSHLFYSTPFTQPHGSFSLTPPPPLPPPPTVVERPIGQVVAGRRAENFIFSRLRVQAATAAAGAAPWVPVVRDLTQVGSSSTPSSSVTESCLTPATATGGGVAQTFAVPRAVGTVRDIAGPSYSTVPFQQIQPDTEREETADERKRKEREETADDTEEAAGEEARGSTSRKRSRAAEMHNISERRRREKINEKMKTLQELIPRCNKTDKASMLEDAIEYVKSLQMQIQMMSTGTPMMYNPNMQRFMPPSAMGMMGMNQPPFIPFPGRAFPRPPPHVAGLAPPYPFAYDPSRVHLPTQQPDPVPNQPQFPGYLNPYSQFVGLQQMQPPPPPPPPPLQNQTTSQLSFGQASSSKEPEDQANKPTG